MRFREAVRGYDDGKEIPFDFDRLIPMPSELVDTTTDFGVAYDVYYGDAERILEFFWVKDLGIETVEQLREYFDANPRHRAMAEQWKSNIEKYGAPSWYEWRCENWDTKWNAADPEVTDIGDGSLHVSFYMVWNFPFPILKKLVAEFPTLVIKGSAEEPNMEIYITFGGRNGEFTWQDDDEGVPKRLQLMRKKMRALR
jgi:hypothetical protein